MLATSFAALALLSAAHALTLPFQRRASTHSTTVVITNPSQDDVTGFSNAHQLLYSATVYVEGKPYQVQIDTGSADFWIDATDAVFNGVTNTGLNSSVQYGDTTQAAGPVILANVTLGEFTVEGQALMAAIGTNATTVGADMGLLGVGPPGASQIEKQLNATNYNGRPFLLNVFDFYPEDESFITFLLARNPVGITEGGVFTMAELVADYASITQYPQLPVMNTEYFMTYMDGLYVNGNYLTGHALPVEDIPNVIAPPKKADQLSIILDSGTSWISANPWYVDAIYKDLPGAQFVEEQGLYVVPCSTKLNVSMRFGDYVYPMDPLDVLNVQVTSDGEVLCTGTFTYSDQGFDFILGDSFMRNVYSLFNFGNWTTHGTEGPYMQILPITDANAAWANYDAANIQRIGLLTYQQLQENANITVSYAEAAPTSYSWSLVRPSATPTSGVHSSYASPSASPSVSSWVSSASPSSRVSIATSHASPSVSSSVSPTSATPSASTDKLDNSLLADAAPSSSSSASSTDYNGLLRNSYIIIGLLGGALALLLGVLIKLIKDGGNKGYRRVGEPSTAFVHKSYEADSEYSTPYDDPARQH